MPPDHEDDVSASLTAQIPGRNVSFYFTDEMTVFQVENQLFRVPQCLFSRHSPVSHSESIFSLLCGDGEVVESGSEANPISLPGVKVLEFETLLLYLLYGTNDNFRLPQSSWVALLSIAHHYEFTDMRERAIREIYDSGPNPDSNHAMLISAAEKYDVPLKHVVPTFVALVMRKEPLTEVEVALFSIGMIVRLAGAREDLLRNTTAGTLPSEYTARGIVCRIWSLPQERRYISGRN